MKVTVQEICNLCRRTLPVLGSACRSDDTSVYRFRRTWYRFFSARLSWGVDRETDIAICGDCWTRLREEAGKNV